MKSFLKIFYSYWFKRSFQKLFSEYFNNFLTLNVIPSILKFLYTMLLMLLYHVFLLFFVFTFNFIFVFSIFFIDISPSLSLSLSLSLLTLAIYYNNIYCNMHTINCRQVEQLNKSNSFLNMVNQKNIFMISSLTLPVGQESNLFETSTAFKLYSIHLFINCTKKKKMDNLQKKNTVSFFLIKIGFIFHQEDRTFY